MNNKIENTFAHLVTLVNVESLWNTIWDMRKDMGVDERDTVEDTIKALDDAFKDNFKSVFGISWEDAKKYRPGH